MLEEYKLKWILKKVDLPDYSKEIKSPFHISNSIHISNKINHPFASADTTATVHDKTNKHPDIDFDNIQNQNTSLVIREEPV